MDEEQRSKTRISVLISCVLLLIVCISAIGLWQGHETDRISELSENFQQMRTIFTEITIHRLEQSIAFERAVRYGTTTGKAERFQQMTREFGVLSALLGNEIEKSNILITQKLRQSNAAVHDDYERLEQLLATLSKQHFTFERKAKKVLALLQSGELEKAHALSDQLMESRNQLQKDLRSILVQFEDFTNRFSRNMPIDETDARGDFFLLWVIGLFAGFCFGALITYRLLQSKLHNEAQTRMLLRVLLKKLRSMYKMQYAKPVEIKKVEVAATIQGATQNLPAADDVTVINSDEAKETSKKGGSQA